MRCTDQLYRLFAHSARKQVCLLMWPSVTEERRRDAWGVGGCCTHMKHGVTNTKNRQCIHGALSSPKPRTKIYMHMQDLYLYNICIYMCAYRCTLCIRGTTVHGRVCMWDHIPSFSKSIRSDSYLLFQLQYLSPVRYCTASLLGYYRLLLL